MQVHETASEHLKDSNTVYKTLFCYDVPLHAYSDTHATVLVSQTRRLEFHLHLQARKTCVKHTLN